MILGKVDYLVSRPRSGPNSIIRFGKYFKDQYNRSPNLRVRLSRLLGRHSNGLAGGLQGERKREEKRDCQKMKDRPKS